MASVSEGVSQATELAKGLAAKGIELAAANADKIAETVDKVADFVDEKTGGKFADQIAMGKDFAKKVIPGDQTPAAPTTPTV